tara:strand:+ start:226 stop:471 length:246 start_codon:yes stop_codon:yes gene_type:complete
MRLSQVEIDSYGENGYLIVRGLMSEAESELPWQMKPEERSASADFRNVIMVAGKDPYAWKGYEQGGKAHVRRFDPVALETD